MKYPKPLQDLVDSFAKFPGIGKKTAERLALFTVNELSQEQRELFQARLASVNEQLTLCPVCSVITDVTPCSICSDTSRDQQLLMVVEDTKDVFVVEQANTFHGVYHVLQGTIAPLKRRGPEDINLRSLIERLKNPSIKEVILALNSTVDGETTSLYIQRLLKDVDIEVSQLAQGLPAGGDLQYADEITLRRALEGRRVMKRG
jgi:recombination protein RecR